MTAFHSKWMDWNPAETGNQRTDRTDKSPSVSFVSAMNRDSGPICLFCRQPVKRGKPGTAGLAGQDLHVECFEKANGKISPTRVTPQDDESTHIDAEERAAIQEEDNYPVAVAEDEDPLHEFDAWIRGES